MEVIEQTYDEDVDAAYLRFSRKKVAHNLEFADDEGLEDFIINLDENGDLVGIEVLNYSDHARELEGHTDIWNYIRQSPSFHF